MTTANGCTQKPHAVVFPWPGQGHINPLFHLSKRLASEYGFSITFVNLEFAHRFVAGALKREESEKLAFAKLGIRFVGLPDGISGEANTGSVQELCKAVVDSGPEFQRLLSELRPPPTCIISDVFVMHTQDAANKMGIPRVAFWTQSAVSFSTHLLAGRGLLPSPGCDKETLIRDVAGAPHIRVKDLPGFLQCLDPGDFMFDFCTRPFTRLEEASCVLMNTFAAMEGESLRILRQQMPGCRFFVIGPVLPPDYFCDRPARNGTLAFWAEDYSCLRWLDEQQEASVLYVSFGSIAELTQEELDELALGLEATGRPILWVLRPGVLEGGGHVSLPDGFEERTKGHVVTVEWAPQLEVLAHPSVGGFFTHAGWNSTLEGVSRGKPMLGFPYFADQMTNAKCMQNSWGNGLALERHGEGLLTRALVESKARAIMTDANIRSAALLLRDGARRATTLASGDLGSSAANFEIFVHFLRTPRD